MNENTHCTWHWQVEAYDVSKWASAGIKGHLWNTSSSFLSSGDFVSEVWVLWNALGGVAIRVSVSDTRWHTRLMRWAKSTRALFSREWSAFIVSFFFGKAPLLFVPFFERIGAIIWPPRLGSSRCWGSKETEIAVIADGACWRVWDNFSSRTRLRLMRVICFHS